MSEKTQPRNVRSETYSQYLEELGDASTLYADARREIYKYAEDGRDIWTEMAEQVALEPGRVLDIAAGNGIMARKLLEQGFGFKPGEEIVTSDIDAAHFFVAQETLPQDFPDANLVFAEADAQDLQSFEDESFDTIISGFYLYHSEDPEQSIWAAFNKLKPGGRFFAATRDLENQERIWRWGAFAADRLDATRPQSFYDHCDRQRTSELLTKVFGQPPEYEVVQRTAANIPGTHEGFRAVREAGLSLRRLMRPYENPAQVVDSGQLVKVFDTYLYTAFWQEVNGIPGVTGKGIFKVPINQSFFEVRKPL